MIEAPEIELPRGLTNGEIAVINLKSTRERAWSLFWRDPLREGIAESLVEQEQLTAQFVGDLTALDRLGALVRHLDRTEDRSPRTVRIRAQVASMAHRFADAKRLLEEVDDWGSLSDEVNRLSLSIDQALGTNQDALLGARRAMATNSPRLEDLVPLAALYADLREFGEADRIYQRALSEYGDTSPFAVALVCFQLGVLWGELVSETQPVRAERWYRQAIEYLPCYVKARVHLAEILLAHGSKPEAEAVLIPALPSGDPEVHWRMANVLTQMGRFSDAEAEHMAALSGFDALLKAHLLAFADHGAEYYSGSGNDSQRAFELAMVNLANRPTLRAFEQAYETAIGAGEMHAASELVVSARKRWGGTHAFGLSRFATTIHAESHREAQ